MDELQSVLREHGIVLPAEIMGRLAAYRDLLLEWNRHMDLTSVKDQDMAARHFLDSLLPLAHPGLIPPDARLIDVGTGAGFPGLPLAIARPDLKVTLLEAQGKRCQFLDAVCRSLALGHVTILNDRAENAGRMPAHRAHYDIAVARAVAPLNILCEYLLPLVRTGGHALCWKGPAVGEEMPDGAAAAQKLGGEMEPPVEMTAQGRRSILIFIHKTAETLPQYPRKNGMPAKRPLKADKMG